MGAIFLAGFMVAAAAVTSEASSSRELIEEAALFDGAHVVYSGEVIGEVLRRGDHAWLNIHDGANAIGVWIAQERLNGVVFAGGYKTQGDIVNVHGIFHRACHEHGGALDIHAQDLLVMTPGHAVEEGLEYHKIFIMFVSLGALICLLILRIFLKKRKQS
jgi:hypothetical protein